MTRLVENEEEEWKVEAGEIDAEEDTAEGRVRRASKLEVDDGREAAERGDDVAAGSM